MSSIHPSPEARQLLMAKHEIIRLKRQYNELYARHVVLLTALETKPWWRSWRKAYNKLLQVSAVKF